MEYHFHMGILQSLWMHFYFPFGFCIFFFLLFFFAKRKFIALHIEHSYAPKIQQIHTYICFTRSFTYMFMHFYINWKEEVCQYIYRYINYGMFGQIAACQHFCITSSFRCDACRYVCVSLYVCVCAYVIIMMMHFDTLDTSTIPYQWRGWFMLFHCFSIFGWNGKINRIAEQQSAALIMKIQMKNLMLK